MSRKEKNDQFSQMSTTNGIENQTLIQMKIPEALVLQGLFLMSHYGIYFSLGKFKESHDKEDC